MTFSRRNVHLWNCRLCGSRLLEVDPPCVVCGGNAARAGRLALQLGTRVRYLDTVERVGRRFLLGAMLRFWAHLDARTIPGRKAVGSTNWLDAGYCLDAPEEMPAGGCVSELVPDAQTDDEPDPYVPMQSRVYREDAP